MSLQRDVDRPTSELEGTTCTVIFVGRGVLP
jgi:hypothetical protein